MKKKPNIALDSIRAQRNVALRAASRSPLRAGSSPSSAFVEGPSASAPRASSSRGRREGTTASPPGTTARAGRSGSMIARGVLQAPTGVPPPTILPSASRGRARRRSALRRAARATRNPVMHLVEDEHGAVSGAEVAQAGEEARRGRYAVHVARDRLDDDRRSARRTSRKAARTSSSALKDTVIAPNEARRHAGRRGHAERERA